MRGGAAGATLSSTSRGLRPHTATSAGLQPTLRSHRRSAGHRANHGEPRQPTPPPPPPPPAPQPPPDPAQPVPALRRSRRPPLRGDAGGPWRDHAAGTHRPEPRAAPTALPSGPGRAGTQRQRPQHPPANRPSGPRAQRSGRRLSSDRPVPPPARPVRMRSPRRAPSPLSRDAGGTSGCGGRDGGGVARHAGGDQEGAGEADRPREGAGAAAAGSAGGKGEARPEAWRGGREGAGGWRRGRAGRAAPQPRLAPQTCPLLLCVFTINNGRHHRMDEFSRGNVPSSELQIYTW